MRKIILLASALIVFSGQASAETNGTSCKGEANNLKHSVCYYEGKAYSVGAIRESEGRYGLICKRSPNVNGQPSWEKHDMSYFFGD